MDIKDESSADAGREHIEKIYGSKATAHTTSVNVNGLRPVDQRSDQDSDRAALYEYDDDANRIFTRAPPERFRLSTFDVTCLIVNRMIGMLTLYV